MHEVVKEVGSRIGKKEGRKDKGRGMYEKERESKQREGEMK